MSHLVDSHFGTARLLDIIWLTVHSLSTIKETEKTERLKIQGAQLVQKYTKKIWSGFSVTAHGSFADSLKQREGKYFG